MAEESAQLTEVKMLVTHASPHDLDFQETQWHHFLDEAPDFPATNDAIDTYRDLPGVEFKIWYSDPPEPEQWDATHEGTMQLQ